MSLTPRQQAIVCFLAEPRPYPPTFQELGDAVGLSSTSSVNHQVRTLTAARILKPRRELGRRSLALADDIRVVGGEVYRIHTTAGITEEDLRVSLHWVAAGVKPREALEDIRARLNHPRKDTP
jgi:SOS-response transcriptional repressor LexA